MLLGVDISYFHNGFTEPCWRNRGFFSIVHRWTSITWVYLFRPTVTCLGLGSITTQWSWELELVEIFLPRSLAMPGPWKVWFQTGQSSLSTFFQRLSFPRSLEPLPPLSKQNIPSISLVLDGQMELRTMKKNWETLIWPQSHLGYRPVSNHLLGLWEAGPLRLVPFP